MSNVGTLFVSVVGRTSSAEKAFKRLQRNVGNLASSVLRVGATAAAAAAGGFTYMVNKQMESIDQSAKLADRLGISTEAVHALGEAAQESGLDMGGLTTGIQTLMRNVGKAGGSGDPIAILTAVSDELSGITDTASKFAVVNKLFGRQGADMLNFLDGLRGKLRAAEEEGQKFGTAFSRVDAAQVEAANIAMGDMKDLLDGVFTQIAINLAPKLTALAEQFIAMSTEGGNMGERVGKVMDDLFVQTARWSDGLSLVFAGFHGVALVINAAAAAMAKLVQLLAEGADLVLRYNPSMRAFKWLADKFGADTDGAARMADNAGRFASDRFDAMMQAGEAARAAVDGFSMGANEKAAKAFLEAANKRAEEIAATVADKVGQKAADAGGASLASLGSLTGKTPKSAEFREVDLRRTAIGGLSGGAGMQKVSDPENKITNEILRAIERRLTLQAVTS